MLGLEQCLGLGLKQEIEGLGLVLVSRKFWEVSDRNVSFTSLTNGIRFHMSH